MFWMLLPLGYAAVRVTKAAVNAPKDTEAEAVCKEVGSLSIDAAKVAGYAALIAAGGVLAGYKYIAGEAGPFGPARCYRSDEDDKHKASDSGMSRGERWIESQDCGQGGFRS
jgi:hypothetical protein